MKPRIRAFFVGGIFFVLTFLLFYVGVAVVLKQEVLLENYLAFAIFSLLIACFSSVFAYIKHNVGLILFSIGYVIAFGSMFYTFLSDMTGWEGLIGLVQMMMILGISIVIATAAEITLFFIDRSKEKKHHL